MFLNLCKKYLTKLKIFNKLEYILKVEPHTKPRMTIRDKWKNRPCVSAYYAFKDSINFEAKRVKLPQLPDKIELIQFFISMPLSWSKKKRELMNGTPHKQVCDIDNLCKSLYDSLLKSDSHIYSVKIEKFWAEIGYIRIII